MKRIILGVLAVATFGLTTVGFAHANYDNQITERSVADDQKTEVSFNDLPAVVQEGWNQSEYETQSLEKIYTVKSADKEYVEFILKTEDGKKAIQFDMDGKFITENSVM
ncbi:MAG: hypothetical protein HC819_24610 [Cyclobacteriaceae bacterium]|nr:hypothetical protein [Cyclobacteriaceae bacterium]